MSSVYKAHDALLERDVAVKVLHDQYNADREFLERFEREARAVARLQHPNIVTVIDRGADEECQYIVFEYVAGENLKELVVRRGRLSAREALEIAIQIARALSFAHEHGLVHRDVKPQNVLLNGDGATKVTDFGIARAIDVETGMTQTGTVLGSSSYIAPEQASGQPVDARTDVYSLGVVLYELLTGDVPFPGESFVAVALKHVHEPPPSLLDVRRDVPLRVVAAIDRALEKNPSDRFPTMDAFAAELEACLRELGDDTGSGTTVIPTPRQHRARPRRSSWPVITALVALLAIGAVVAGLLKFRGDATPATATGRPVALSGLASYDPYGDHREHDNEVALAADNNPATFWTTEDYHDLSLNKPGVGIILDAGTPVAVSSIRVRTDTPGFTAEIRAGNNLSGPFTAVSASGTVAGLTTFEVHSNGGPMEYYVIWITKLPPGGSVAHVNEARAFY